MASQLVTEVLRRLPEGAARHVARAPGRLDVMGGIAECTGSLMLGRTLGETACVGMQRRTDGIVSIEAIDGPASPKRRLQVELSQLLATSGLPTASALGTTVAGQPAELLQVCALAAVGEGARAGVAAGIDGGLSVVVGSELEGVSEAGKGAAVVAATLACLASLSGVVLDEARAAGICRRIEDDWLRSPLGVTDALCGLLGEPDAITQVHSGRGAIDGAIRLPSEVELVGIDCGAGSDDARLKYDRARTAAFMGRLLIDRIIQHDGAEGSPWDGFLSRVTVTDYVERFRDRIPTKLKGEEFLERFGETGDRLTTIEPSYQYKIRSRTEHHIYEHARACQFVECVSRAIRTRDYGLLAEAGELMYASHWSYGQRCGLGSVKTDRLVSLLRHQGSEAGIFGAKVSGHGCGGVVTVLMHGGERPAAALEAALEAYQAKNAKPTRLFRGSSPGALVAGVQQL